MGGEEGSEGRVQFRLSYIRSEQKLPECGNTNKWQCGSLTGSWFGTPPQMTPHPLLRPAPPPRLVAITSRRRISAPPRPRMVSTPTPRGSCLCSANAPAGHSLTQLLSHRKIERTGTDNVEGQTSRYESPPTISLQKSLRPSAPSQHTWIYGPPAPSLSYLSKRSRQHAITTYQLPDQAPLDTLHLTIRFTWTQVL